MTEQTAYDTIAEAEASIIASGYRRDSVRHVWVSPISNTTIKVVRTAGNKFALEKA